MDLIDKRTETHACDCISRQAAIDAVRAYLLDCCVEDGDCHASEIEYDLNNLPSAQPTIEPSVNCSEFPNNSDTISRQAAIDALDGEIEITGRTNAEAVKGYVRLVKDRLERLPSAQPERQKGEWIDYTEDGYVECPFCHSATNCDGNKDELHFCFSCGADMRGKQDG